MLLEQPFFIYIKKKQKNTVQNECKSGFVHLYIHVGLYMTVYIHALKSPTAPMTEELTKRKVIILVETK